MSLAWWLLIVALFCSITLILAEKCIFVLQCSAQLHFWNAVHCLQLLRVSSVHCDSTSLGCQQNFKLQYFSISPKRFLNPSTVFFLHRNPPKALTFSTSSVSQLRQESELLCTWQISNAKEFTERFPHIFHAFYFSHFVFLMPYIQCLLCEQATSH